MSGWFSLRRAGALFHVETRQLLADRSALMLIFALPLMQILLYGYGVHFMPRDVTVAIASDDGALAPRLAASLQKDPVLKLTGEVGAPGSARLAVSSGKAALGVELLSRTSPTRIEIVADGSDPSTVNAAVSRLQLGVWRRAAQIYGGENTPQVSTHWLNGGAEREAWAVAPGLIGVVVMVSMLFLGAMTLVRERERGTWESLLSTPVRPLEALAGKLAPYLVIGCAETVVLLGMVHLLFGVPLPLASLALAASAPLFAGAYLILGFVFSAIAQTQLQAVQGAVGVYLPSLLLSGFLFPFSGMPTWARWVGEALPLTHYVRASREILLRGAPASTIWPHLLPIGVFTALATLVALAAYRRRLD